MAKEKIATLTKIEDIVEFNILEGIIEVREAGNCNNCGGNCNQCSQPTCKQTCRSCRKTEF